MQLQEQQLIALNFQASKTTAKGVKAVRASCLLAQIHGLSNASEYIGV